MYDREYREKVYFTAGELVKVKHELDHCPIMVVQEIVKSTIKSEGVTTLLGVQCMWFSDDLKIQTHRFSTKDLIKVK